jgi:hypothetical protein
VPGVNDARQIFAVGGAMCASVVEGPLVCWGDVDARGHVTATGARRVEIMADFTDWSPLELGRSGGPFERELELSAGTHRMLVRIDGGAWRPAANTPAVDDDLGGRVGLLVVP